ncbi:MAG: AAA-like domain-containing protein [Acidobacteriota bacterium]|nr:AAA-like domain-containing protein [Acidobacteriota bacterium]
MAEDERDAWLVDACGDNKTLLKETRRALAETCAPDTSGLSDSTVRRPKPMQSRSFVGFKLGSWRLVKELGAGGMGEVWLAERADAAFQMTAAVKLIKPHFATGEVIARFKRERQLLADLKHPNITHLLDGGTAPDGRPYLVMEYVQGETIDRWCESQKPARRQILALFRQVCSACAYAHRKGVLHRDIKPSNIMIDNDGRAKLMDFGIASLKDDVDLTHLGAYSPMTPEYASPERRAGREVTEAADIYSLGLVLFKLLTGIQPRNTAGKPVEVFRAWCSRQPDIPEGLIELMTRLLTPTLQRRFESMDEVIAFLDEPVFLQIKMEVGQSAVLPGEVLDVDAPYYIMRQPVEEQCFSQITRPGALIRIKAPWQMGKTSLLVRIRHYAEERGHKTVLVNFQLAEERVLNDLDRFLRWFCAVTSRKLHVPVKRIEETWDDIFGAKDNCTAYFEEVLLPELDSLVLALDETDRLFDYPDLARDFLGLLRVWHEMAKTNDVWRKIRLVVVHKTEIYIPMDINQSPFNVGYPITLPEFTGEQILELAARYSLDWTESQVHTVTQWIGGHPYLTQLILHHIARHGKHLEDIMETAVTEEGLFAAHLKRLLNFLEKHDTLALAMNKIVNSDEPVRLDSETAFKLSSMGLVNLHGNDVSPRCRLYREFFNERLARV